MIKNKNFIWNFEYWINFLLTFRPSDYFIGEIKIKDKVFSKLYGSYLNFIEFDDTRYWDIRENIPVQVEI